MWLLEKINRRMNLKSAGITRRKVVALCCCCSASCYIKQTEKKSCKRLLFWVETVETKDKGMSADEDSISVEVVLEVVKVIMVDMMALAMVVGVMASEASFGEVS